ncbi:unnamed protein product [Calypogeia fissa]
MSSGSRDQLSSLEKRQSDILARISYLETNINSENVLQDQKMSSSTELGSLDVCGSVSTISLVSGGAQKLLFRWGHSACLRGDSHLIIFGGYGGSERHARLNDILELDVRDGCVRSLAASGTPAPIMAHSASMVDHNMIVIGGRRSPTCILNTVSVLDLKSLEWKLPEVTGAEFPPRHRHAAAVVGSNIYVQGGLNGTGILGDLYMLDTTSWTWSVVSCQGMVPSARFSHSLAAFGGKLYIYGGRGRNAVYGDVHVLDLETLVWSEAEVKGTPPSPRYSHTMTVVGHYFLVIGGCPITPQGSELVSLDLCRGATVVDLFSGIGYYVLPFLLKAGAKKEYACEWNPNALVALRHNLAVNGIEARCEVIEGDNRTTAPDIVSLGLLPSSEGSWPVAVEALTGDLAGSRKCEGYR